MTLTTPLKLSAKDRASLERLVRKRWERAETVQRARIILRLAEGDTYHEIREALGCSPASINLWRKRFLAAGISGLNPRYRGSSRRVLTPELEAKILSATRKAPPDGSTHWSSRRLGEHLGINHMLVHRAWQRAGLKPHGFERYMASNDPDFESKATDIIGLYLDPAVSENSNVLPWRGLAPRRSGSATVAEWSTASNSSSCSPPSPPRRTGSKPGSSPT